jgi:putative ABC transport system substrate-binding protein
MGQAAAAIALGLPASFPCLAQASKQYRIGYLGAQSAEGSRPLVEAFQLSLRRLGYLEGKNLVVEYRFANGQYDTLPKLADELLQLRVQVIVAATTPAVRAVQGASRTTPIVMVSVGDPIRAGFVTSLNKPGGNITGVSNFTGDTSGKQLEILISAIPTLSSIAVLINPDNPFHDGAYKDVSTEALKFKKAVVRLEARSRTEFAKVMAEAKQAGIRAMVVLGDGLFFSERHHIARLALDAQLATMCAQPQHAEAGSFMSYGADTAESYRAAANYVDKILKGAAPAALPVEQPTKIDFVINNRTAKALKLSLSSALLIRADKIID